MFWSKPNRSVAASVPGHSLIELRQVAKTYQTPAGPYQALKDASLRIAAGEFVAIVGKSGSGKSTLLNMITGIDRPSEGEIVIGGVLVHLLSESPMATWRGRQVGTVFQFFQLIPTLTAVQNVILPMEFAKLYTPSERRLRALNLLEQVGVVSQAEKLPSSLSGGQQQRVAIARALANDPPILIADEPTGNLDSHTAGAVLDLFDTLAASGKTILMVTHDDDLAARAHRVITLVDGRVQEEAPALLRFPMEMMSATYETLPMALEEAAR